MSINIDRAFTKAFQDYAFGLPIAYPNTDSDFRDEEAYAQIKLIPNDVEPLAVSGRDVNTGIFQVILRYSLDEGDIKLKLKAEEILSKFKVASTVTYGGDTARITRHKRDPGYSEEGWYKMVLTIRYIAFLAR